VIAPKGGAVVSNSKFSTGALRLAGLSGAVLGWRPHEFWTATPSELATIFDALTPRGEAPPTPNDVTRLLEQFPDG
jgi:Phage tail assembly chaperone protein, TAC